MKFEEILPLLRDGAKARVEDGSEKKAWFYGTWVACRAGFPTIVDQEMVAPKSEDMWTTLVCLNNEEKPIVEPDAWGMPLWMVMSDKWELIE
ncbi:MAG: hypothetical protein [Bacteriophage sp.]|nr:MAG: hypothetical protein [Bacteriophage sp.]